MRKPKVVVPLAEGFEEIEAVSLIDVMRRGGIEVYTAAVGDTALVKGANGITVQADGPLKGQKSDDIDMVVLPGGWGGTRILAESKEVQSLLKEMDAKQKLIGAICAAPFALGHAGVLKPGFTCYPGVQEQISQRGYRDDMKVVQTQNVMTSRGPATAICFGIAIIEKLVDKETAMSIKGGVLADFCQG